MINSVRNTVLSILNKNNYGYISPSDFNLFSKQAQMDIFEDYFYQYNYQIQKENARQSGTGYADIKKGYEEVIESFSETKYLTHNANNNFFLPAQLYTGDDYYLINKVLGYETTVTTGAVTTISATQLIDINANFKSTGVQVGDIVFNLLPTPSTYATVTNVVSTTTIDLSTGLFNGLGNLGAEYIIFSPKQNELEKVTQSKITMLNNSVLTSPSRLFPAYIQQGETMTAFPASLSAGIECQYFRYPKDPKWTYISLTNGEPSFDSSQSDYQDFELPNDDEPSLIMKILQYAGMSIREVSAVQFAQAQDQQDSQAEK